MINADHRLQVQNASNALAVEADADVLMLNGVINEESFRQVELFSRSRQRKHVILVLVTHGGDPHAGYRIARTLKRNYSRFTALVSGPCKSAGTLVTLGADELVMTDTGELGPLDIQLWSREHLGERDSANDITFGLAHFGIEAMDKFFNCFSALAADLETAVAAEAASKLVGRMYGRVFESVHPRHVGSVVRSNRIGSDYAKRLMQPTASNAEAIRRLVHSYPAHEFVIDREEASEFLSSVRAPRQLEIQLAAVLPIVVLDSEKARVLRLAPELPNVKKEEQDATDANPPAATSDDGRVLAGSLVGTESADGGGAGNGGIGPRTSTEGQEADEAVSAHGPQPNPKEPLVD